MSTMKVWNGSAWIVTGLDNTTQFVTSATAPVNPNTNMIWFDTSDDSVEFAGIDIDSTLSGDSDIKVPSQKAVKTAIDSLGATDVGALPIIGGILLGPLYLGQYTTADAPATVTEGAEYYDLTLHKKRVYTGSAWETVTSS